MSKGARIKAARRAQKVADPSDEEEERAAPPPGLPPKKWRDRSKYMPGEKTEQH